LEIAERRQDRSDTSAKKFQLSSFRIRFLNRKWSAFRPRHSGRIRRSVGPSQNAFITEPSSRATSRAAGGEPGYRRSRAAVGNAIFAGTGERIQNLPIPADELKSP
jgi:hypothetical protein